MALVDPAMLAGADKHFSTKSIKQILIYPLSGLWNSCSMSQMKHNFTLTIFLYTDSSYGTES